MTPLSPVMTLPRQHYTRRRPPAKSCTTAQVPYGTTWRLLGVDVGFLTPKDYARNLLCTYDTLLTLPSVPISGQTTIWYVSCL